MKINCTMWWKLKWFCWRHDLSREEWAELNRRPGYYNDFLPYRAWVIAVHRHLTSELLARCPNVLDVRDEEENSLLHWAARREDVLVFRQTLSVSPDLFYATNANGETVLHAAGYSTEMVAIVLTSPQCSLSFVHRKNGGIQPRSALELRSLIPNNKVYPVLKKYINMGLYAQFAHAMRFGQITTFCEAWSGLVSKGFDGDRLPLMDDLLSKGHDTLLAYVLALPGFPFKTSMPSRLKARLEMAFSGNGRCSVLRDWLLKRYRPEIKGFCFLNLPTGPSCCVIQCLDSYDIAQLSGVSRAHCRALGVGAKISTVVAQSTVLIRPTTTDCL